MNKHLILIVLISSLVSLNCGQDIDYEQNWLNLFRYSRSQLKTRANFYLRIIESSEHKRNVSAVCANKLIKMVNKIDQDKWAAQSKYYQ